MITELSSETEVAELNDAGFGDENVFRLNVSMNTLNSNVRYTQTTVILDILQQRKLTGPITYDVR